MSMIAVVAVATVVAVVIIACLAFLGMLIAEKTSRKPSGYLQMRLSENGDEEIFSFKVRLKGERVYLKKIVPKNYGFHKGCYFEQDIINDVVCFVSPAEVYTPENSKGSKIIVMHPDGMSNVISSSNETDKYVDITYQKSNMEEWL